MAVSCDISIIAEVSGLGEDLNFCEKFAVTETIIKAVSSRQIQATAGTEEALNLCGIDADGVELIIIKATTNGLIIDADYDGVTFDTNDYVPEGECRIIKPFGDIWIDGSNATKAVTVDVLIVGSA